MGTVVENNLGIIMIEFEFLASRIGVHIEPLAVTKLLDPSRPGRS